MFSKPPPTQLYLRPGLYLQHVTGRGRGVFCREPIAAGEVIEVTPALVAENDDVGKIAATFLSDYVFSTGRKKDVGAKNSALPMGVLPFCNHMAYPNADWARSETPEGLFFTLTATNDIPAETEICVSYGLTWFANRR